MPGERCKALTALYIGVSAQEHESILSFSSW
jgi:hypothetical protein